MTLKLSLSSTMPSIAEWILLLGFVITVIALIPQYITLSVTQYGYLSLLGAIFVALTKFLTTEEEQEE